MICAQRMNGSAVANANSALSQIFIGPDTIFAGDVLMLNANIFRDISILDSKSISDALKGMGLAVQPGSDMVMAVRQSIANIYVTLRNICGYIMLAGLIYTGIQILITSNMPTKKTQYLMILQDWLIGMILLIFSHIIMIGVFYVSDTLTNALKLSLGGIGGLNATLVANCLSSFDSAEQIICLIMLAYLIWLTVIFAIAYFKRFLWVCVLIVFAPLISVMYAFGPQTKQIYSKWLREFVMTVFVQPFHLIIYWVLVSIPMDIVNSNGGMATSIGNSFEVIYALVAISFIRPAESYMRQLFGMNQGIANMASYDSGKQTFDQIKRTVTETVKKVGLAIATIYTGGAAGAVAKGAGSIAAKKGGEMIAKEGGKQLAGKAASSNGAGGLGNIFGGGSGGTGGIGDMLGGETGGSLNPLKGISDMGINEAPPRDPVMERYNAEGLKQNSAGEYFNPWTSEYDANYDPHKDKEYNPDYKPDEKIDKKIDEKSESNIDKKDTSSINAVNVTITAGNVEMNGSTTSGGTGVDTIISGEEGNNTGIRTQGEEQEGEEQEGEENQEEQEEKIDDDIKIKNKRKFMPKFMSNALDNVTDLNNIIDGKSNLMDLFNGSDLDERLKKDSEKRGKLDQYNNTKKAIGAFEENGGATELYKGFNSIRDTFFVTPPPQDWKGTVEERERNKKEKDEKTTNQFVKNEGNKKFMFDNMKIEGKSVMQYYQDKYKGQNKSEDFIKGEANDRIEKELESLAKSYIPYGINDVGTAYQLRQDEKKYGYTPEEAILHSAKENKADIDFAKFNLDTKNISNINHTFSTDDVKVEVKHVSEGIPDAKEYYKNGVKDISTMINADQIALTLEEKLGNRISEGTKIAVASAIAKKGEVKYNGEDKEIKKIFDDINKSFKTKETK